MSSWRTAGPLALLACALGCVKPHPGGLAVVPGCYALYVENWPAPVAVETGLRSLPPFIALDTTAGVRGHRVVVPDTWEPDDPNRRSATWSVGGAGSESLVLNFLGPSGDFTAALQPSGDGYIGEGVGLTRNGSRWPSEVHLSLVPTICAGLAPAQTP
jgi:hypothetical protein